MNYKYQYTDQISRQALIDANTDKLLIEEDNITEGNFLIFSDTAPVGNQITDAQANIVMLNNTVNQLTDYIFTYDAGLQ